MLRNTKHVSYYKYNSGDEWALILLENHILAPEQITTGRYYRYKHMSSLDVYIHMITSIKHATIQNLCAPTLQHQNYKDLKKNSLSLVIIGENGKKITRFLGYS